MSDHHRQYTSPAIEALDFALENAAKDPKIKGLFIEIAPDFSLKGYAYLESIAYLIKKFKLGKMGKIINLIVMQKIKI